ncbi:MAG: aldo/keto reductase [Polyangiaceae bacterium]|nr:aldo/keto reductase [Polyangiaceae bacterium]MCW5792160.1 aldo/keto reductase [Polyangiaceae bacterium]
MQRQQLGVTGLNVTSLGLGTWGLSGDGYGKVAEAQQDAVIERARALGLTLYETADVYGHGDMERRLGRLLKDDPRAVVVTKVGTDRAVSPPRKRFDPDYLRRAVSESVERLGLPRVVVLLHNPSLKALEQGEATSVLQELTDTQVIRGWGVSAGDIETGRAALERGAQVLQLAYNALWRRDVEELKGEIEAHQAALLARSVLAHGLLCGHWSVHKDFPDGDHRGERWTPDDLRRRVGQLAALRSVIGGEVLTMRSAALRFVLATPVVTSAILGPRSVVQLDQLVREVGREQPYLSAEKLSKLDVRLTDVGATT